MKQRLILVFIVIIAVACNRPSGNQANGNIKDNQKMETGNFYPELKAYIETVLAEVEQIPEDRKSELRKIAAYIQAKHNIGEKAKLTFICTHNSRRSHMSQIWAATAAAYFGIENIETYSGGTESTAFNPRAVATIERAGFRVENNGGENPKYEVDFDKGTPAMVCFSKTFDDPSNPSSGFSAVMTCSDADKNCPFIPGTEKRIAIPYEDPKVADGTEYESAKYDERCRQIATEMFFVMGEV